MKDLRPCWGRRQGLCPSPTLPTYAQPPDGANDCAGCESACVLGGESCWSYRCTLVGTLRRLRRLEPGLTFLLRPARGRHPGRRRRSGRRRPQHVVAWSDIGSGSRTACLETPRTVPWARCEGSGTTTNTPSRSGRSRPARVGCSTSRRDARSTPPVPRRARRDAAGVPRAPRRPDVIPDERSSSPPVRHEPPRAPGEPPITARPSSGPRCPSRSSGW